MDTSCFLHLTATIALLVPSSECIAASAQVQYDERASQKLITAARARDLSKVQALLALPDINVNAQNKNGYTALTEAAFNGYTEIVKALLAHPQINVNAQGKFGFTPLHAAVLNGHLNVVEMFMADHRLKATKQHKIFLLAWGISQSWIKAVKQSDFVQVQAFLTRYDFLVNVQDETGKTALIWAASKGDLPIVSALLAHPRININAQDEHGLTALIFAAYNNDHQKVVKTLFADTVFPEITTMLLEHRDSRGNLDVNVNAQTKNGETALMIAKNNGNQDIVHAIEIYTQALQEFIETVKKGDLARVKTLLAQNNININTYDTNGIPAFIYAAENGHHEIVRVLLEHGADVNVQTTQDWGWKIFLHQKKAGSTALMCAAHNGYLNVTLELLKASNINVNARDNGGRTARMLARNNGHQDIVQAIEAYVQQKESMQNNNETPFSNILDQIWLPMNRFDIGNLEEDPANLYLPLDSNVCPAIQFSASNFSQSLPCPQVCPITHTTISPWLPLIPIVVAVISGILCKCYRSRNHIKATLLRHTRWVGATLHTGLEGIYETTRQLYHLLQLGTQQLEQPHEPAAAQISPSLARTNSTGRDLAPILASLLQQQQQQNLQLQQQVIQSHTQERARLLEQLDRLYAEKKRLTNAAEHEKALFQEKIKNLREQLKQANQEQATPLQTQIRELQKQQEQMQGTIAKQMAKVEATQANVQAQQSELQAEQQHLQIETGQAQAIAQAALTRP